MFEGRIKPADYDKSSDSPVLRRLRWTDLVARLEASRELRQEAERPCDASFASLDPRNGANPKEDKSDVNHDALSHGKTRPVTVGEAAGKAANTDRE